MEEEIFNAYIIKGFIPISKKKDNRKLGRRSDLGLYKGRILK